MDCSYGQAGAGFGKVSEKTAAREERRAAEKANDKDETHDQKLQQLVLYYSEIERYILAFGLENKYTEDAVQDAMMEAIASIDKLKDPKRMRYWALKIAKRVAMRYLKQGCREKAMMASYEEYVLCHREKLIEPTDKDLWDSLGGSDIEEMREAISKNLTPREQRVLNLYYVYGHSLKEISRIIGESYSNTRQISAKAKIKLRAAMSRGEGDEE